MARRRTSKDVILSLVADDDQVLIDMSAMELAAEEIKADIGRRSIEQMVAMLPPENTRPKSCPRCGQNARLRAAAREREVRTLSGVVRVVRNYHYCEACKHGFYPRDRMLGLPEDGELTAEMEKRVVDFALNDTDASAAKRFSMHYGQSVSSNLMRRASERVGTRLEACAPNALAQAFTPEPARPAKVLTVATDGGHLSVRGRGAWRECKLAVVVRDDHHAVGSASERGQISQARYTGVLGDQTEFRVLVAAELKAARAARVGQVVWLGDGAPGNWTLASSLCPEATQILDWFHAIENAMRPVSTVLDEGDVALRTLWKRRIEELLATEKIGVLVGELMDCLDVVTRRDQTCAINDVIRYIRNNERRMQYATFRAKGFAIGSGVVESAHKHVIQIRMKRAGQHWGLPRGRRMVRLRAAYQTAGHDRWHDALTRVYRERRLTAPKPQAPARRRASNY